jgi:AraC-like DNA-binding protein
MARVKTGRAMEDHPRDQPSLEIRYLYSEAQNTKIPENADFSIKLNVMFDFHEKVLQHPHYHRQFACGQSLITMFNCPMEARLMKTKLSKLWTDHNYLFYVVEGRKIWHTAQGSYDIGTGSCAFVRKGAFILEQLWDVGFCVVLFFIPDGFICDVLLLNNSQMLSAFFHSMSSHFSLEQDPDSSLLELKFKELVLTIAGDEQNEELLSYFCSLLYEPQSVSLQRVMSDNYCFNLKMEQYARLSNRSLSAFKRDFRKIYNTTPGKWLMEKRLAHAGNLLSNMGKTVGEASFESGFESPSHFSRLFKKRYGVAPSTVMDGRMVGGTGS